MTVEVTLVDHPLVAATMRGLRPRTPSSPGSLALAMAISDAHERSAR
ncbi:MAG: hypothetical protein ABIP17_02780 [Ilumatobacteraceae bacterium]